jgi:hypothetical protein
MKNFNDKLKSSPNILGKTSKIKSTKEKLNNLKITHNKNCIINSKNINFITLCYSTTCISKR